jgi:hypothetical protein
MKQLIIFLSIITCSLHAFDNSVTFRPLTGSCKQAFETCFDSCKKQFPKSPRCHSKKKCLNQCNAIAVKSLQSQKCYNKCEEIICPSQEECTQKCFEQTKPGICRQYCRSVTPKCITECKEANPKDPSTCIRCCYTQKQLCEKRCCS